MIGKKVGRWTVLRETRKNGKKYYECRCDCGNIKEVYYRSIEMGSSQSCGCLRTEQTKERAMDLTGQRFGKLLVLHRDPENDRRWICECDCGGRKSIRGTSLTRDGGTRSCGCDQRKVASETGKKTVAKNSARQVERNVAFHTNFQVITSDKPPKNNTSGHKGVWWDKNRGLWEAYIQVHSKRKHLGRYGKLEDAMAARRRAEEECFAPLIEERSKSDEA